MAQEESKDQQASHNNPCDDASNHAAVPHLVIDTNGISQSEPRAVDVQLTRTRHDLVRDVSTTLREAA
jgi:hypothetical protein